MPTSSRSLPAGGCGGFSLIELIVVVAVIAVLAGLLLPAIRMVKDAAATAQCGSNMRQVGMLIGVFETDNSGQMPGNAYATTGTASWCDILNVELLADEKIRMPRIGDTSRASLLCPLFDCPPLEYRRSYRYNYYAGGGDYDLVAQTSRYGRVVNPPSSRSPAYNGWKFYCLGAPHTRFNEVASKVLVQETDSSSDYCLDPTTLSYRHNGGRIGNAVFLDGHVEGVARGDSARLRYGF